MADCDCSDVSAWAAWHDRIPGGTPTLHVVGTSQCPTPNYRLELRRRLHQGANPKDLLLDLIESAPTTEQPAVVTAMGVEYVEDTDASYDTVSIMPDGPRGIPVREVSRVA